MRLSSLAMGKQKTRPAMGCPKSASWVKLLLHVYEECSAWESTRITTR